MPYGRPADTEFHRHWSKVSAASAITKGKCYACRYCHHKLVYNTGNMRRHLETCEKHLKVLREQIASKNSASNPQRQRKLAIPTLTSAQKHEFDLLCARIPLLHGHSFALFECEDMVSLFRKALPAYKLPSRHAIAGPLLDTVYMQVKTEVDSYLSSTRFLNVITDESTNINKNRISNISVHTDFGSLFYISEDIGTLQMNAHNIAAWVKSHLRDLSRGNFARINSISTDTCPTMFAMWEELKVPQSKNALTVDGS